MADAPDEFAAQAAARLMAIRKARARSVDQPSLADVERYRGRAGDLKRAMARRADPTVKTHLDEYAARLKKQARILQRAGAAVKRAFSRELAAAVLPVQFVGNTLTLAVPDESVRFQVDRQLRAGGRSSIENDLSPSVHDIRVVVTREPLKVVEEPRPALSAQDVERERWEEVDAGAGGAEALDGRGHRCPDCDWEFAIELKREGDWIRTGRVVVTARCPNCGGSAVYRMGDGE